MSSSDYDSDDDKEWKPSDGDSTTSTETSWAPVNKCNDTSGVEENSKCKHQDGDFNEMSSGALEELLRLVRKMASEKEELNQQLMLLVDRVDKLESHITRQ